MPVKSQDNTWTSTFTNTSPGKYYLPFYPNIWEDMRNWKPEDYSETPV